MISERLAGWVFSGLVVYAAFGIVFALLFVMRGVNRVDPVAQESSWGFRAMIFPGSVALWPLLLKRWMIGPRQPTERNPHRDAASGAQ